MSSDPMEPKDVRGPEAEGGNVYGDREKTAEVLFGGSTAEAVVGAGAVILAIIGLANMWPGYMAPIATIAVGAALLFQGGAIAARYSHMADEVGARELGSGLTGEILGGGAGIVLGVLSFIGIWPSTLMAVAVIVLGGTLLIGSSATSRLRFLSTSRLSEHARRVTREAVEMASGTEVLIGLGAIVLGILALLGFVPGTLVLVALLALGASVLFSGSAVSSRMLAMFRR
jgi:hypothetical protein